MPLYYPLYRSPMAKSAPPVPASKLKTLEQQVHWLQYLTSMVLNVLPNQASWQVASYTRETLCVVTHEASVAAQVRYLKQQYIKQLKQYNEFEQLKILKVLITTPFIAKPPIHRVKTPLSPRASSHLIATAVLFNDKKLTEALIRIANEWK